jgi:hypothetical protein
MAPDLARRSMIVAAVRPHRPNTHVIAEAAAAARERDSDLLVMTSVPRIVINYPDTIGLQHVILSDVNGELFSTCVEVLYSHNQRWWSRAIWGDLSAAVARLAAHQCVTAIYLGPARHLGRWRGLFRRSQWRLEARLGRVAPVVIVEREPALVAHPR